MGQKGSEEDPVLSQGPPSCNAKGPRYSRGHNLPRGVKEAGILQMWLADGGVATWLA